MNLIKRVAMSVIVVCFRFDIWRLNTTSRCLFYINVRLGIRQKTLERILLAAAIAAIAPIVNEPFWSLPVKMLMSGVIGAATGYIGYNMLISPFELRVFRLVTGRFMSSRLFWIVTSSIQVCLLNFKVWPYFFVMTILLHVIALPYRDDPPKRKRKLSLAKLKGLFGSGWMPKPVEEPA